LHQLVIETGEMLVFQRGDDRFRERDRAGFDWITGEFPGLDENLRKDVERVLGISAGAAFEVGSDKCVMDLVQRPRELLAVLASPLAAPR
jgi:hypothetical protein